MNNEEYEEYAHDSIHALMDKQEKFKKKYGFDGFQKWEYNDTTGIFKFIEDKNTYYYNYLVVGSFSTNTNTWMWSWNNEDYEEKVKKPLELVKNFGIKNKINELQTGMFESSEQDGWKFTSIAARLLGGKFGYRMPIEHLMVFVILTREMSPEEAQAKEDQYLECDEHGFVRRAFVCKHINNHTKTGFIEPRETYPGVELEEDEDLEAVCDLCQDEMEKEGEWNEKSEAFAEIRVVCENCFFEMKAFNLDE